MRKSVLFFVSVFSLLFFVVSGGAHSATPQTQSDPVSPVQENAALLLVKKLSLCVDTRMIGVGTDCVRKEFFPLLGLGKNARVLYGTMGMNSGGRWFSFVVKKLSPSGKTSSIFDVTLYLEWTVAASNERAIWETLFEVNNGTLYGKIPKNDVGLVSIYDNGRGYNLTEDKSGNVAMDIGLEKGPYNSADSLLQKGKTIGALMEERLTSLEKVGKGGFAYSNEAARRYNDFSNVKKWKDVVPKTWEYRTKFYF